MTAGSLTWCTRVIATVAALQALACQAPAPAEQLQPEPAAVSDAAPVRWANVRPIAAASSFEAGARLLAPAASRAEIVPPVLASIRELRIDKGQRVERDAVLAVVLIPDAARARAILAGERLRQAAYRDRLARLEQLQAEGLARAAELVEAKARLNESQAIILEARALLDTIEASGLRPRGKLYEVRAPLAGVVIELAAASGSMHGPSDGPLAVIAGGMPSRVEARFAYAPPDGVRYELVTADSVVSPLVLAARAPQLMATDATQLVWFDLAEPSALPEGTLARARIAAEPDLWIVPRQALVTVPGAAGQTVRTESRGELAVRVIASTGEELLVRAALQAGDRVAIGYGRAP